VRGRLGQLEIRAAVMVHVAGVAVIVVVVADGVDGGSVGTSSDSDAS
jgi:hypothetical protein